MDQRSVFITDGEFITTVRLCVTEPISFATKKRLGPATCIQAESETLNMGCGSPIFILFVADTATLINMPSPRRKKSSRPSSLHRGKPPEPFRLAEHAQVSGSR